MHLPLFRPHCLARVAVVRGRECFLIVVLWPKRHVRALGGLTQMRWGPADCSAAVGGRLGYSFSVDFWSGFEVAHFRSSLLLFKKGEGRKRGWRGWVNGLPPARWLPGLGSGSLHLTPLDPPLNLPAPLLPTKLDTFEMQSKWSHRKKEKDEKTQKNQKAVKAIKYHRAPERVLGSFHTKWIFRGTPTSSCEGSPCLSARAQDLGFSIQSSAPTNHTCTVAKKPQNPEPPSPGTARQLGSMF